MSDHSIKQGSEAPSLEAALSRAGSAVNLSAATSVTFRMEAPGRVASVQIAAVVVDATAGEVRVDFTEASTARHGHHLGEFWVVWPTGQTPEVFPDDGWVTVDVTRSL
jgi:hypothetical protein